MQMNYSSSHDEVKAVEAIMKLDWKEVEDVVEYNALTLDSKMIVLAVCKDRIQALNNDLDNDLKNEVEGIDVNYE